MWASDRIGLQCLFQRLSRLQLLDFALCYVQIKYQESYPFRGRSFSTRVLYSELHKITVHEFHRYQICLAGRIALVFSNARVVLCCTQTLRSPKLHLLKRSGGLSYERKDATYTTRNLHEPIHSAPLTVNLSSHSNTDFVHPSMHLLP